MPLRGPGGSSGEPQDAGDARGPQPRVREAAGLGGAARGGLCEEMEHVWVQDCTVEGMVQVLKKQAKGVLLVQDELVAWVLGDNKYRSGKGADRQFWLSAWSS